MPLLALALSVVSGYLLTAALLPRGWTGFPEMAFKLSLSLGFGLGIFSLVFFLVHLLSATHVFAIDILLLVPLLLLYLLPHNRSADTIPESFKDADIAVPKWIRAALTAAFLMALSASLYSTTLRIRAYPHGDGWDASAIWNLHARFLFLGGTHWRDGFSPLIPWSHPDYPLLLPAAIAHFWTYLGHDDPAVPAMIGIVFAFSTLALLVSSIALLRGQTAAMLAGLALSSTPFFVEQGTSQYADVPLSFFILASIVLLNLGYRLVAGVYSARSGLLMLAGLAAGFAAWTKNEGLLFLFAVVLAQATALRPSEDVSNDRLGPNWKILTLFLLGAAPALAVTGWFKHSVATPGDLLSDPQLMIHKILTPLRYRVIVQWFAKESLRFGNWWIVPGTVAMGAFYLFTRHNRNQASDPIFRASVTALGLTLAGYFAIYLITPRDLYWHLRFSLNRLFLQLWPSTIFLFFLFVARQTSPESQIEPNLKPKQGPTVKKFVCSP